MQDPRRTREQGAAAPSLVRPFAFLALLALLFTTSLAAPETAAAEDLSLEDAQKLYTSGRYTECISACAAAIDEGEWDLGWWLLKVRAEMTTGQYAEAL